MYTPNVENTKNPYKKGTYKQITGRDLERYTCDGWRLIRVITQIGHAPVYLLAATNNSADLAQDLALALDKLARTQADLDLERRGHLEARELVETLEVPSRIAARELELLTRAAEYLAADAAGYFGPAETYTGAPADVPDWVRSRLADFAATHTGGDDAN